MLEKNKKTKTDQRNPLKIASRFKYYAVKFKVETTKPKCREVLKWQKRENQYVKE